MVEGKPLASRLRSRFSQTTPGFPTTVEANTDSVYVSVVAQGADRLRDSVCGRTLDPLLAEVRPRGTPGGCGRSEFGLGAEPASSASRLQPQRRHELIQREKKDTLVFRSSNTFRYTGPWRKQFPMRQIGSTAANSDCNGPLVWLSSRAAWWLTAPPPDELSCSFFFGFLSSYRG